MLKLPDLPHEHREKFWSTADLRTTLIESGVDERITTCDVRNVLGEMHAHRSVSQNRWQNKCHCCLDPLTNDIPMEQESMCDPSPEPNFWLLSAEGTKVIDALVDELDNVSNKEKEDTETEKPPDEGEESANLSLCCDVGMPGGHRVIENFQLGRLLHWSFNHRGHCNKPCRANICLKS